MPQWEFVQVELVVLMVNCSGDSIRKLFAEGNTKINFRNTHTKRNKIYTKNTNKREKIQVPHKKIYPSVLIANYSSVSFF